MGLFDFLRKNRKKSADEQVFEALKNFDPRKVPDRKPESRPVEKPVYDESARIQEVSGIRDDQKLIEIINANKDSDAVLKTAIARVSDQKLLVKVVERTRIISNYSDAHLRALIIKETSDQEALLEIAGHERHAETRKAIIKRINDEELIKRCLLSDGNIHSEILDAFLKKIPDQNGLAEIYQNAQNDYVRDAALKKITDKTILKEIILKNPIRYTFMAGRLKKKEDFGELVTILEDIMEKDAELKKNGGYICRSCSGENPAENGKVSCVCRHCGAENHDWEYISHVQEYRDYAVGCTYYECKRCGKQKDYKNVDMGYLE